MTSPSISLQGIAKCFGSLEVIRHLDLDVLEGERHAMIGPNGAGKSTLVSMISGLIRSSAGEIFLNGRRIDGLAPERINRRALPARSRSPVSSHACRCCENLRIGVMARHGIRYSLFWRRRPTQP